MWMTPNFIGREMTLNLVMFKEMMKKVTNLTMTLMMTTKHQTQKTQNHLLTVMKMMARPQRKQPNLPKHVARAKHAAHQRLVVTKSKRLFAAGRYYLSKW